MLALFAHGTRRVRAALAVFGLAAASFAPAAVALPFAAAGPERAAVVPLQSTGGSVIDFTGRGWGHGRGLSQYGALGYARNGWSSTQILDHYYGGTSNGPIPGSAPVNPGNVRVELRNQRQKGLIVTLPVGNFIVLDAAGNELFRHSGPSIALSSDGLGGFQWQSGASCAGPWSPVHPLPPGTMFRVRDDNPADDLSGLLQVCDAAGATSYSGELQLLDLGAATAGRPNAVAGLGTVNVTTIEEYLRGVVPKEVPPAWPAAALEAQSVAARSYAMAGDTRQQPYADTCDTTLCQVYGGRFRNGVATTTPSTDAAVAATTGIVRVNGDGSTARTEFSSSSGGYTAGVTFPAVRDEGDAVADNPNDTWSMRVSTATAESTYGLGRLLAVVVTQRNGLDPFGDGGRVIEARLDFQNGSRTVTGDRVRTLFGIKSDWFTPGAVTRSGIDGTPTANFVTQGYETYLGRSPSTAELAAWYDRIAPTGSRVTLTTALAKSPEFAGVMIDELYSTSLGRQPDAAGSAYWLDVVVGRGVRYSALGTYFYGSQEYHQRQGGTSVGFVTGLYRDLLGREPDAEGLAYWTNQLDVRKVRLDDVAFGFYASLESRRDRADRLYVRILGRPADAGGRDAAAARIAQTDDLVVAAELGASDEFWAGAQN